MKWWARAAVGVVVFSLAGCASSDALPASESSSASAAASTTTSLPVVPENSQKPATGSSSSALIPSGSHVAPSRAPEPTAGDAAPDPRYAAAVQATSPLARGRSVLCGDVAVPMVQFAVPGRAELSSSPSSRVLRGLLAHDPWGNTASTVGSGWTLLAATDKEYVFAQRVGKVGMGHLVTFVNKGGKFVVEQFSGCGTVVPGPGEDSAIVNSVKASGNRMTISWDNGSCALNGPQDQVVVRVETAETTTAVHLLVVTKHNPLAPPPGTMCAGVGVSSTATTTLTAPLGTRTILNDAKVPAETVPSG